MKHLDEEQIVLHFYGDAEDEGNIRHHLAVCSACRQEFERAQSLLSRIGPIAAPEPPAVFEEKIWLNLQELLPQKRGGVQRLWGLPSRWALAGVVCLLVMAAFLMGRFWPQHDGGTTPNNAASAAANPQRIVLVTVGGHLERSQMLLVEIMNADTENAIDLATEQQQARDLLDANHLYRVSAQQEGDHQIARLLDQLGRVLAEVANGPSEISAADLQQIRSRIQAEGLLFKVRVVGSEVNSRVRRQEHNPAAGANQRL